MKLPIWVYSIPYKDGGRCLEGADCWGLVVLLYDYFYKTHLPEYPYIKLPSITDTEATSEQIKEELKVQDLFFEVSDPEFGDVILINVRGEPLHIGFCLDEKTMIHTEERHGVVIENFMEMKWKTKISGFYRKL